MHKSQTQCLKLHTLLHSWHETVLQHFFREPNGIKKILVAGHHVSKTMLYSHKGRNFHMVVHHSSLFRIALHHPSETNIPSQSFLSLVHLMLMTGMQKGFVAAWGKVPLAWELLLREERRVHKQICFLLNSFQAWPPQEAQCSRRHKLLRIMTWTCLWACRNCASF